MIIHRQRLALIAALLAVLGLVAVGTSKPDSRAGETSPPAAVPTVARARMAPFAPRLFAGQLLAYIFGGMTPAQVSAVQQRVAAPVTAVYAGEVSVASGNARYPEIPVETMTADPGSYARAVGRASLAPALTRGLVLSRSGAQLRHVGVGDRILLVDGRSLSVSAVVADHVLGGAEMGTSPAVLGRQAASRASYLLVPDGHDVTATSQLVRQALRGHAVRVKANGDNGFMSSVDTVLTQAQIKLRFGEFAMHYDSGSGGHLTPDPAWEQRWIVSRRVPQLGLVTCNKAVLPYLAAAMQEITDRGLGALVHTADFEREGGCYNPRVIPAARGGTLAAHSWGIAVDINVDTNSLGDPPHQDPRLVAIMASHGFTWGGRWLRPDGAHFEWVGTAVPQ